MPYSAPATIRVGDDVRCEFVFRNSDDNSLSTPASVSVEIYNPSAGTTPTETITESDSRVTIGSALAADNATAMLKNGETNDGTGAVQVLVTPDAAGLWTVYCRDSNSSGAEAVKFEVLSKTA